MSMNNPQIRALVDRLVVDLERIFRESTQASVQHALRAALASLGGSLAGGAAPRPAATAKRGPGRPKKAAPNGASSKKGSRKAGKRIRRSPAELEAVAHRVLDHVRKNGGQRSEVIRSSLKLGKPEWLQAVARLTEKGQIKAKGQKRATTYSAA